MANPDHLVILDQGIEAWNKWRKEKPNVKPDLSEADLNGRVFYKFQEGIRIDLRRTDLGHTNLENANLERARLENAYLEGANLKNASLVGPAGAFAPKGTVSNSQISSKLYLFVEKSPKSNVKVSPKNDRF